MHVARIHIRAFKRFHDLTVELDTSPRLVVMAGPNGMGKSSLIDAVRLWHGGHGSGDGWQLDDAYHRKAGEASDIGVNELRAAFDRPWPAFADRLVDDMIALESIAVASTELAYTISVRVSGILADSDADRVALFRLLKDFYRVRSAIVHGGRLKEAAVKLLQRESELRDVVRVTLRGMLNLRESDDFRPTTKFLGTTVDDLVLDSGRRGGLRVAMGTSGWRPTPGATSSSEESRTTRLWTDH